MQSRNTHWPFPALDGWQSVPCDIVIHRLRHLQLQKRATNDGRTLLERFFNLFGDVFNE